MRYIIWFLIFITGTGCVAREVNFSDIAILNKEITKSYDAKLFFKALKDRKTPTYAELFLAGLIHKKRKEYKSAILNFTRAFYEDTARKSKKFFPGPVYSYVSSSFKTKSPLYNEVLYNLAECFLELGEKKYALKFLNLMDGEDDVLHHDAKRLEARIYARMSGDHRQKAIKIYKSLWNENANPVIAIRLASLYEKEDKLDQAVQYYLSALEFPANDWTYKTASDNLDRLLEDNPKLKENIRVEQKVRLAEGYRILKQLDKSLKLYNQIQPDKLPEKYFYFYMQNKARLLVDLKRYSLAVSFAKSNESKLKTIPSPSEKYNNGWEALVVDLSTRLLKKYRYNFILNLVPPKFPAAKAMRARLQALHKKKRASRLEESKWYLENIDANSNVAERVFFHVCLEKINSDLFSQAESCLKELASVTAGNETAGRALFFLGFLQERKGNWKHAIEYYKKTYLEAPASMHAFYALRKIPSKNLPLPENKITAIRDFIASIGLNKATLKKFFEKKKEEANYAVDSFYLNWENKLSNLEKNLSPQEKKAMLFLAMGEFNYAAKLLNDTEKERKLLLYQKTGFLTKDPYLTFRFTHAYLKEKKKQEDIFLMSKLAYDALYPRPFLNVVKKVSQRFSLEPARIYALMKQESSFFLSATSPAGASGIMQVMPYTAKDLNRRLKIKNLDLHNPNHSILLGAKFYADMSKMFHGDFEKIAMAYNAGPGRLLEWEKRFAGVPKVLFLEEIPFEETYYYVKKTRKYYDRYKIGFEYFF